MAYTLAQVDNLTTNRFIAGVAEDRFQRHPLASVFPVVNVTGTNVTWNRESTTGSISAWQTATFTQMGGAVGESTPSTTQVTAILAYLVDGARVPLQAIDTKSDITPIERFTHAEKWKAFFDTFATAMFYGDNSVNSNEFDGIHSWVDNTLNTDLDQTESASAMNMTNLLSVKNAVKTPSVYVSNGNIRNRMSQAQYFATTTASNLNVIFGQEMEAFGGIPWLIEDYLTMTETDADPPVETGSSNTSVLLLALDDADLMVQGDDDVLYSQGPTIIQSANGPHMRGPLPIPGETSVEFQYLWWVGLITPARRTLGRLRGITDAAIAV